MHESLIEVRAAKFSRAFLNTSSKVWSPGFVVGFKILVLLRSSNVFSMDGDETAHFQEGLIDMRLAVIPCHFSSEDSPN